MKELIHTVQVQVTDITTLNKFSKYFKMKT